MIVLLKFAQLSHETACAANWSARAEHSTFDHDQIRLGPSAVVPRMAEPPRRPAWLEEILAGLPPAETAGVPTAASDLDVADVRPAGLSDSEVLIELPEEPRAGFS